MCLIYCCNFAWTFVVLVIVDECCYCCRRGYLRRTTCHQQDNVLILERRHGWLCISLTGLHGAALVLSRTVVLQEKGLPGMAV